MELPYFVLVAELGVLCTILLAGLSVMPQCFTIYAKAVVAAWTLNMREARCFARLEDAIAVAAVGRTCPTCCRRIVDEVIE